RSAHGPVRRCPHRGHAPVPGRRGGLGPAAAAPELAAPARQSVVTALLEGRSLTQHYLGLTPVGQVDFDVEPGAVVGLMGPKGWGKTPSWGCLRGFQPADGGRGRLDGRELTGLPANRIARAGLTRTFQTVRAYDELTVLDNLRVAAQEEDGVGWLAALLR